MNANPFILVNDSHNILILRIIKNISFLHKNKDASIRYAKENDREKRERERQVEGEIKRGRER